MTFECLYQAIPIAKNQFDEFLNAYRNSERKIFLFGAGLCGSSYVKLMERHQLHIEGVIDNFKRSFQGKPTLKLEEVLQNYNIEECIFIISAPGAQEAIYSQLLEFCNREQIFLFAMSRYCIPENEPAKAKDYLILHKADIKQLYNRLGDQQSRDVLVHTLLGRMTADLNEFASVWSGDFYYPPDLITLHDHETMVELGSYNGDTLLEFVSRCPDFKRAYCFEPDDICIKILHDRTAQYADRIVIIPKVAWDKKEKVGFVSDGGSMSSKVAEQGDMIQVEAAAVDDEVKEDITYMKMDVEGSEMKALQGAKNQIIRNKPRLAISVYHKNEDFVEIPRYILSLRPDYKLYLRHHGKDDTDTVLYAI